MAITVQPITPDFAAEVGDVVLGKPLAADDLAAIRAAFTKYAVLVFPDQEFDDESQLDFARHFGPLETTVFKARKDHKLRLHENMADVGNLDAENRILETNDRQRLYNLGNRLWHTDSSFKRLPAYCSMLHARSIPPIGGQTEFADMRAAYDALPEATKRRIAGLVAEHSIMTSRAKLGFADFDETEREEFKPVPQVLVRRLQDSGRMSLYIASHAGAIRGMADAEAKKLLDELTAHATQRQFVYSPSLAGEGPGDLGRPLHHASRHGVRRPALRPRHAPRHGLGRGADLRADGPGRRRRMTPAAFAKIALSLDGAIEGAHGGHADFRAGGKVFATLGYPGKDWGMVKLAPEQQQMLVAAEPAMFVPVKGTWGLRGATSVRLAEVDARTMRSALTMAWQNVTAPKPKKARRAAA